MQKVQEAQLRGFETNLKENGFWTGRLVQCYLHDEAPESILEFPDLVRRTGARTVRNAARRWFNPKNMIKVVLLPEEAASP
jgi:predicted Zn-dependent peptidase